MQGPGTITADEGHAMPMHDWTRARADVFHQIHFGWVVRVYDWLNRNFSRDCYATFEPGNRLWGIDETYTYPPTRSTAQHYWQRRRTVAVRRFPSREYVALVEIVSPVVKDDARRFARFVHKLTLALNHGIHVLVIDPLPPSKRDPQGLHAAIWRALTGRSVAPSGKPLTLVSYVAGEERVAYADAMAVGDAIPDMPLFLTPESYVSVPLEQTYQEAWRGFPEPLKEQLEDE